MRSLVLILTTVFVIVFASMTVVGGYMTYQRIESSNRAIDAAVTVSQDSVEFRIERAGPGLVILCLGAVGLLLMAYKVPTREVLGYKTEGESGPGLGLMMRKKVLDTKKTNIPLPVWWLLKKTERFERVDDRA
ncbi:hypothetical protein C5610_05730 [Idiomarina sp. OT37-5b]|uniref:hypothetical protein n=1 Tax=Idiomarina sp. OT37-5b TaxID=2100422 RepID=UPI000CF85DB5|nr:hypothetical protein [Idiomarina sp. OT37-5b]AVJ55857.1 hypothetical protein C5610_05730 [Idiomarina sp. OT37-5b]